MHLLCLCVLVLALPASDLAILPALQRVDLQPEEAREIVYTITAPTRTTITAVIADCACIRVLSPMPLVIGDASRADIRLRITGMRPGMEDILVATSAGILRAQVQIVGPGAGRGRDQMQAALATAAGHGWSVLGIAHDLRGNVRHCGCSHGALGGIGRLSRLPRLAGELHPGVSTTWVLTGDTEGRRVGVAAALADHGWRLGDPRVLVTADPLPALGAPGLIAVIPTTPVAAEHRRLLRPVLSDGMVVEMLLVDSAGMVQARHSLPVDDSLPDDDVLARGFADPLSTAIRMDANPSTACAGCHAPAFAAWQASRHARALDSLPAADRTDSCITCHVTSLATTTAAPGVSCQSCHQGSEAHVASSGRTRTTGTVSCRSCHDAKHHPTFMPEAAWLLIRHGR